MSGPGGGPAWSVVVALLFALAIAPSWNSLENPAVIDDPWIYVENPALRGRSLPAAFTDPGTYSVHPTFNDVCYRPLMTLSLALDARRGAGREDLRPARQTNLVLHAAAAVLAFWLGAALLAWRAPDEDPATRRRVALAAAAVFAAHPISAFAAQYVSNRGFLLFLLAYYSALGRGMTTRLRGWDLPLWVTLGLLAKETGVTTPVGLVVLALFGAGGRGGASRRRLLVAAGCAAVFVGYFLVRGALGLHGNQFDHPVGLGDRAGAFLTQFEVHFTDYLPAYLSPGRIRWFAAFPEESWRRPGGWLGLAAVAGLLFAAWRARRRYPVVSLCAWLYPVTLIPTTLLKQPIPVNFYRLYPGSIFFYLAAFWAGRGLLRRRGGSLIVLAVVAGLAIASRRVGRRQRSARAVIESALPYGMSLGGRVMAIQTLPDPDLREDALTRMLHAGETATRVWRARAAVRLHRGDYAGARDDLKVVVGTEPHQWDAWALLQAACRGAGRPEDAAAVARERRARGLARFEFPYAVAQVALRAGDRALAEEAVTALKRRGGHAASVAFFEGVFAQLDGDLARAAAGFREAVRQAPNHASAWMNLGIVTKLAGRCEEAVGHLRRAAEAGARAGASGERAVDLGRVRALLLSCGARP